MIKTFDELLQDLADMNEARDRITSYDPSNIKSQHSDGDFIRLNSFISSVFDRVFEGREADRKRYRQGRELNSGPIILGGAQQYEIVEWVSESKEAALAIWDSAIEQRKLEIGRYKEKGNQNLVPTRGQVHSNKIFIVHGHDHEPRSDIALLLKKQGLEAVILSEQASKNKTIIEKFESNSEVGFAIVLMTADDYGKAKLDPELHIRARQNVYLELGFFIGKLGRDRVCALRDSDVVIPSDLDGILIEEIDARGAWRISLLRELKAAGYSIDMNHL